MSVLGPHQHLSTQTPPRPISSSNSFRIPKPLGPAPPTSLKLMDENDRDDRRIGTQVNPPDVSMSLAEYGLEGMGDGGSLDGTKGVTGSSGEKYEHRGDCGRFSLNE